MRYKNCRIVTDGRVIDGLDAVCENGVITALVPADPAADGVDLGGRFLAPGFIDIHCHGGGGFEFSDGDENAVIKAAEMHEKHGTRTIYPTLSAASFESLDRSLSVISKIKRVGKLEIAGVHLEGPFLSSEMTGAQDPGVIHEPRPGEYIPLADKYAGLISRWSYAPELDENCEFAKFLQSRGIVAATAHSAAKYEHMRAALGYGNRLVTHLYSCTSTVTRDHGFRSLGVIESAFLMDELFVETIADGRHLPLELLKMIWKIKGDDRMCLVTDAIRPGGTSEGGHGVSCSTEYIVEDGVAKLPDRSAFAGSIATTDVLLRRACEAGIPLASAVKMLTETPATVMGLKNKGRVAVGYEANFTVFDSDLQILDL